MAQINLLPWRENLREERKKRFISLLVVVLVVGGLSVFAADRYVNNEIKVQQSRNSYLQSEIDLLNAQVAEINRLQEQKREIRDRMNVIQDLQGSRPVIVRVFDELVRTLPEGVYFQTIQRSGNSMNIVGVAESYGKLTDLMRRLEGSDWFAEPELRIISAATDEAFTENAANQFTLDLALITPREKKDLTETL